MFQKLGFEDLPIYANSDRSAIMKVATIPKVFPFSKVIGWIIPREDVTRMILANTKRHGYATYSLAYVSMAYNLPTPQTSLTESWLKELNLDMVETVKKMMILGKKICTRPSGEYDTSTLHTPYKFIALMLN